jgi:hypothetical protein
MSTTTTNTQADLAGNIIRDTAAAIGGTSTYSPGVADALGDLSLAIGDVLVAGDQAAADLAELQAKADLLPAHGFNRLKGEVVAEAEKLSAEALGRAEAAEARLRGALMNDALPTLDPAREALAREELKMAFDGADGKTILSRVSAIAQGGSREAVAVLLRTGYGQTLLASRGAAGREFTEAMSHARTVAAAMAAEKGENERQRAAGRALGQLGKLGGARTAARMHVRHIIEQ